MSSTIKSERTYGRKEYQIAGVSHMYGEYHAVSAIEWWQYGILPLIGAVLWIGWIPKSYRPKD